MLNGNVPRKAKIHFCSMTLTFTAAIHIYRYISQYQFLGHIIWYVQQSGSWKSCLGSAVAAGELVAGRCDNDTTHKFRPDSGPRLRQHLIIDGSKGPGLASNCITGHFSIAICESCGDVCWMPINRHYPEIQSLALPLSFSLCSYEGGKSDENIFFQCWLQHQLCGDAFIRQIKQTSSHLDTSVTTSRC